MKSTSTQIRERRVLAFPLTAALPMGAAAPISKPFFPPPDFQSRNFAVRFARTGPTFTVFTVDAFGQGKLADNPVLPTNPPGGALKFVAGESGTFAYMAEDLPDGCQVFHPVYPVGFEVAAFSPFVRRVDCLDLRHRGRGQPAILRDLQSFAELLRRVANDPA